MKPALAMRYLRESIPLGPHPEPHAEWISVRLDVVQAALERLDHAEVAIRHVRNLTSPHADASDKLAAEVWLSMFGLKD